MSAKLPAGLAAASSRRATGWVVNAAAARGATLTQDQIDTEVAKIMGLDKAYTIPQEYLIGETGEALDAFAQTPFVRMALKMMQGPAKMAGLGELQAFLERGFDAFRTMRDASEFLYFIVSREREFSAKLFYGGTQLA